MGASGVEPIYVNIGVYYLHFFNFPNFNFEMGGLSKTISKWSLFWGTLFRPEVEQTDQKAYWSDYQISKFIIGGPRPEIRTQVRVLFYFIEALTFVTLNNFSKKINANDSWNNVAERFDIFAA